MPLEVGNTWTYTVRSGMASMVTTLEVAREAPVAGVEGAELRSNVGLFRLAWKGDTLFADSLASTRFSPPLPLLKDGVERWSGGWKGRVTTMGRNVQTTAGISQEAGEILIGSKKVPTVKVSTKMRLEGRNHELESQFAPGLGLVQQEHRIDGILALQMKYQDGPKRRP